MRAINKYLKYDVNYYEMLRQLEHYESKERAKDIKNRMRLAIRLDRGLYVDVAHGTIETIYAVFNRVMWLTISNAKRIINKIIGCLK